MGDETKPDFDIRRRVIGEGGQNVHHIQDETHAKVYFEKHDGGNRVIVSADREDDFERALQMVRDLLGTVYEDYDAWLGKSSTADEDSSRGKKSKGKGKGKGKKGDFNEVVQIQTTEREFDFKHRFIGDKGKYIHHIQDQTGAQLWVDGDNGGPMSLNVSADTGESVN